MALVPDIAILSVLTVREANRLRRHRRNLKTSEIGSVELSQLAWQWERGIGYSGLALPLIAALEDAIYALEHDDYSMDVIDKVIEEIDLYIQAAANWLRQLEKTLGVDQHIHKEIPEGFYSKLFESVYEKDAPLSPSAQGKLMREVLDRNEGVFGVIPGY
jgi:hypothetical protein